MEIRRIIVGAQLGKKLMRCYLKKRPNKPIV
jgi:hypothetical protein